jgi:hypothetical protein
VISALYTTLLPALVDVDDVEKSIVEVPVVKAHRKFAFVATLVPVCVRPEDAPVTVMPRVPPGVTALMFVAGERSTLAEATVTVAVGVPENKILFTPAPQETDVVDANPIVTVAVVPKTKLCEPVVITAVVVVIVFVPVTAPAIDNPKPGDVSVDETIDNPVVAAVLA